MDVSTTRTLDRDFNELVKKLSERPATKTFVLPQPDAVEYAANLAARLRGLLPQDRIAFAIALMDSDVALFGFTLEQSCMLAGCRPQEVRAVRRSLFRAAIVQMKMRVLRRLFKFRGTKSSRPTMMAAE